MQQKTIQKFYIDNAPPLQMFVGWFFWGDFELSDQLSGIDEDTLLAIMGKQTEDFYGRDC